MALPWYKFYPADWLLSETRATMTLAERGAYRDLIDIHMTEGSISADPMVLANRLGVPRKAFAKVWPRVSRQFEAIADQPGRLVNAKCLRVADDQQRLSKAQASRARGRTETESGRSRDQTETKSGPNEAKKGNHNDAQPLCSQQTADAAAMPHRTESDQSQNRTEEETTGSHASVGVPTEPPPSFSNSESTDDRPTAGAGTPGKWKPSEADAANLARLMAESTAKTDERFAADILQLAADGSSAAKDYAEVEACVRDAAAHAKSPPKSNGFFETAVQRQFAPEAPRIANGDVKALAGATRMDRRATDAEVEANRERNRRQLAERLAKVEASRLPGYEEFQRAAEAAGKGSA